MSGSGDVTIVCEAIREATPADSARIIEMGRSFLLNGPYRDQLTDNPAQVQKLIDWLFANEQAKILVYETEGRVEGVLCFILYPHYFSGELCANEMIWYVGPEHRGRASLELLWAAEKMAYEMGAIRMQLTAPTEQVGEIYKHLHYSLVEVGYQARLADRVRH